MSPFDRSRNRLKGVNVRQILEASNLPADLATAIADKCAGLLGPEAGDALSAKRYHWLRRNGAKFPDPAVGTMTDILLEDELDDAVDRCIGESEPQEQQP